MLERHNPQTIAVNVDTDVAFASGLHSGEFEKIHLELSDGVVDWSAKLVNVPQLAVEFVGTMPTAQLEWYKKLQGTAWAMISEAFSKKVVTPGVTTTQVQCFILSTSVWDF